jgi:hypothetical protein
MSVTIVAGCHCNKRYMQGIWQHNASKVFGNKGELLSYNVTMDEVF